MPISHEPQGYSCPFCALVAGEFNDMNAATDIIVETDLALARIGTTLWGEQALSPCLVIPRAHTESLYTISPTELAAVGQLSRDIALALKTAFACDGVSTRQHNEPAGNQTVWHFHQHVFPRWTGDEINLKRLGVDTRTATRDERAAWSQQVRQAYDALDDRWTTPRATVSTNLD